MSGLLHVNRFGVIEGGKARVGCYEEVLKTENLSRQELLQLDREGRCLVTDHGSFGMLSFRSCQLIVLGCVPLAELQAYKKY